MNQRNANLVSTSLDSVKHAGWNSFSDNFHSYLSQMSPELASTFQKNQLGTEFLNIVISSVDVLPHIEKMHDPLRTLGRLYFSHGITEEHYPIVGEALLASLSKALGNDFTEDVQESWEYLYVFLAEIILAGIDSARKGNNMSQAIPNN